MQDSFLLLFFGLRLSHWGDNCVLVRNFLHWANHGVQDLRFLVLGGLQLLVLGSELCAGLTSSCAEEVLGYCTGFTISCTGE